MNRNDKNAIFGGILGAIVLLGIVYVFGGGGPAMLAAAIGGFIVGCNLAGNCRAFLAVIGVLVGAPLALALLTVNF